MIMDFQQKYLTEKKDDTSPSQPNVSKEETSINNVLQAKEQFFQLVDSESPIVHSTEDLSKSGTDPRRHIA